MIATLGITLEKRNLELNRELARQRYRQEALLNRQSHLRLKTQQLGAPERMIDRVEGGPLQVSEKPDSPPRSVADEPPLLYWQRIPATQGSQ